jgi:hypothetical protein
MKCAALAKNLKDETKCLTFFWPNFFWLIAKIFKADYQFLRIFKVFKVQTEKKVWLVFSLEPLFTLKKLKSAEILLQ